MLLKAIKHMVIWFAAVETNMQFEGFFLKKDQD